MRAVRGSVVSSRPLSLSKAAATLARFAAAETGARPEIAAYLRRASTAFNELVQFHREIKAVWRGTKRDAPRKEEEEDGSGGDGLKEEKKRRRKKEKEKAGMEDGELRGEIGAVDGRDLMEDEGNIGGGVGSELEEMKDANRKKKKKRRRREAEEEEKSNLGRKEEMEEEERHGKRRKKKKKKDKGEREEEGVGDGLDGEGRDGDTKERRGLDYEIEWHKKKKKKERREIEKED
ncbi:hypothetical protein COCNU_scaffold001446G000010 [Cocos nucifera]|nr:hypothetical protein [Cocos nucifera]